MERCGAQSVAFIVSIVLARLLDPSVYGTVAIVSIFMLIMQAVFVPCSMTESQSDCFTFPKEPRQR